MTTTRDDYTAAKAEARACGEIDFPSFEEWSGKTNPKDAAMDIHQARYDRDEYDLY
jgi:hypothetical protein